MINNPVLLHHRRGTSTWQQQNNRNPYILPFIMLYINVIMLIHNAYTKKITWSNHL